MLEVLLLKFNLQADASCEDHIASIISTFHNKIENPLKSENTTLDLLHFKIKEVLCLLQRWV